MNFKNNILQHFSCQPQDWRGPSFRAQMKNIVESMLGGEMLAVIGEPGCGKKTIVNQYARTVASHNQTSTDRHNIVYVQSMDKERIRIGQIANAMIYDLSDETPRRDPEARTRQLAKILGIRVVKNKEKVTVVIEQAHRLHANTIRAIKELRELKFLGYMDLFAVVMIGHRPLKAKIEALDDVVLRTEILVLDEANGWMTMTERIEYLKDRWGELLNAQMRKQISLKYRTPLAMDRVIYDRMKTVFMRGDNYFKESDFLLNLKEIVTESKLSYEAISQESKLSRTTVSQVINNQYKGRDDVTKEVEAAVSRLTENSLSKAV